MTDEAYREEIRVWQAWVRVHRSAYVSRRPVVPPGSLIASHVDEAGRDATS